MPKLLLILAMLTLPVVAGAQPLAGQHEALALVDSVRVEVQLIGAAGSTGLTTDGIRATVEGRLREGGIAVRDHADDSARGDPRLRVAVQAVNAAGGFAFLVSVQLVERVVNYRKYAELVFDGVLPTAPSDSVEPLEIAPGIKWEAQALGTASSERAAEFIPEALLGYVDRFVDDYLTANSR